jgi:fructoselysine 3-epimerase
MESMMNRLSARQICGSNFSYQHFRFERFLDDMVKLGLQHLEIWGVAPHLHLNEVGTSDLRRIKTQLRERDLVMHCLTPEQVLYPINIASGSTWLREMSVDLFRKGADICEELGATYLFLTSGRGGEDEPREDAWQRSVDGLGAIVSYAERRGVTCLLEPLQRVESNLVHTTADIRRMLNDVGSPNLKITLDTVAMSVAGETVADYAHAFGADVRHVHLVDGTPAGHLVWGDGELPMGQFVQDLADIDYSGFVTFELFGDGSYALDPLAALRRSLAAARAVMAA